MADLSAEDREALDQVYIQHLKKEIERLREVAQPSKEQITAQVLLAMSDKVGSDTYGVSHALKINKGRAEKAAESILSLLASQPSPAATVEAKVSDSLPRVCTCHPDDNPPRPCPQRFAYSECVKAHNRSSAEAKIVEIQEAPSLNREGREHPRYDNPRDPFASPDRLPPSSSAGNEEADALRRKLQLHAGDVQSLSGEVDMWRVRALEAEEELARLRDEPQGVLKPFDVGYIDGIILAGLLDDWCNGAYDHDTKASAERLSRQLAERIASSVPRPASQAVKEPAERCLTCGRPLLAATNASRRSFTVSAVRHSPQTSESEKQL